MLAIDMPRLFTRSQRPLTVLIRRAFDKLAAKRTGAVDGLSDILYILLAAKGVVRLAKVRTVIEDRPGRLHRLLAVVSSTGANVVSIQHDRANVDVNIGMSMLELTLETNDSDHLARVLSQMEENGYKILPNH